MAAYATGASWSFPSDLPGGWAHVSNEAKGEEPAQTLGPECDEPAPQQQQEEEESISPNEPRQRRRHYPSRQCRICLEVVQPTFDTESLSSALPAAFQRGPRVTYSSEEGGRLLRPCKCKGSQKYVHEECLSAWRMQDPLRKRNYWQCPTCRYQYRLERLRWGKWIGSTASQIVLTLLVLMATTFVFGFVADPIINLYLDPVTTLATAGGPTGSLFYEDEPASWSEHFAKGLATIGLLGFAKLFLTVNPLNWLNMRGGGIYIGGNGGRNTGRERLNSYTWAAIILGLITFLYAVWKGVRSWSRRLLERAGERVMDVPGGADDDEEEDDADINT